MATLTLDLIGMCVVLRRGERGPYALGFLRDPGHLQTLHYQDGSGARVAALSFCGSGEVLLRGLREGDVQLRDRISREDHRPRLPFLDALGGMSFKSVKWETLKEALWAYIPLPGGTLTTLPAHVSDAVQWEFRPGGEQFTLTDRLRYTADIEGQVILGNKVLEGVGGGDVYVTIASVDRDYGSRSRQEVQMGFPLTEFALFYRCTGEGGPIPRCSTPALDPDSPICPMIGIQYE